MLTWQSSLSYAGACLLSFAAISCQTSDALGGLLPSSWFEPDPTVLRINFRASPDVNPDVYGNPRAIKVRFYVLKSVDLFEDTGFFEIKAHDEELFADDLKLRKPLEFEPGEERQHVFEVNPDDPPNKKLFAAVVASYRDLSNTRGRWRSVVEVRGGKKTDLIVHLDRLEVSIDREE